MDFTGFYHEMKSNYAYAVDIHTLHIRLRTGHGVVSRATLIICDPYNWVERKDQPGTYVFDINRCAHIAMRHEYTTGGFDFWFAEAAVPTKRAMYAFAVENETETYLYAHNSITPYTEGIPLETMTGVFYHFPYLLAEDLFNAPEWVKDTVWYEIFPERYTGDLSGIITHLDELQAMGVTGLYFTPIFKSPSTHKYNTDDYFQIDPKFGDNAVFGKLVDEAHKRGIKIMLDLVFNHIGSTHPFWRDVMEKGKASRYYDCFFFKNEDALSGGSIRNDNGLAYETFANVANMPKWNTSHPFARRYLLDVAVYWARTYAIDGFRLDVANEVPHGFWREFRQTVRAVNPALYIVGEVWEHAAPWLQGDQFDAVMNYEFARAVWDFVSGKTDGDGLREALSAYLVSYPKDRQRCMFNLIGSHDTSRILTTAKGSAERVRQAFTLLLTFTGSPCVFYGDEIGIAGEGMDRARQPMTWEEDKQNRRLRDFVCKMIALRAAHPAMKSVEVTWRKADANGVAYEKQTDGETVAVVFNGKDIPMDMPMPEAWVGKTVKDLLLGQEKCITAAMRFEAYETGLWVFK